MSVIAPTIKSLIQGKKMGINITPTGAKQTLAMKLLLLILNILPIDMILDKIYDWLVEKTSESENKIDDVIPPLFKAIVDFLKEQGIID